MGQHRCDSLPKYVFCCFLGVAEAGSNSFSSRLDVRSSSDDSEEGGVLRPEASQCLCVSDGTNRFIVTLTLLVRAHAHHSAARFAERPGRSVQGHRIPQRVTPPSRATQCHAANPQVHRINHIHGQLSGDLLVHGRA